MSEPDAVRDEFAEPLDDWLARQIYRSLSKIIADGRWEILEKLVNYRRSLHRGTHSIKNRPFKLGLIYFLGDDVRYLRNRQKELSDAMEYAYRHRVPSKHFNGFVKQAGQKRIAAKLAKEHVEPGFKPERIRSCP